MELSTAILELAGRLQTHTHALLTLLRRFDAEERWRADGASGSAAWLSTHARFAPSTAHEYVRVARCLGELAAIDAAFAAGRISYCQVRAMTRVADRENEEDLVRAAEARSGAELEHFCRGLRDKDTLEGRRPPDRYLRRRPMPDGTVLLELRVTADEADEIGVALREEERERGVDGESSAEERRADALLSICRRRLRGSTVVHGADRTMLLVHLDLSSAEEPHATLHDSGRWIGRAALDRLACDCSYVVSDGKGVGPKSRTVPMHVQRALLMRDKTCTFPGCTHRGFVDAHHLRHWARGGAATLDNLILLCTYHHRLVHDGGFSVVRSEEGLSFRRPDGSRVTVGPPRRAGPYGDVA